MVSIRPTQHAKRKGEVRDTKSMFQGRRSKLSGNNLRVEGSGCAVTDNHKRHVIWQASWTPASRPMSLGPTGIEVCCLGNTLCSLVLQTVPHMSLLCSCGITVCTSEQDVWSMNLKRQPCANPTGGCWPPSMRFAHSDGHQTSCHACAASYLEHRADSGCQQCRN